jgi:hypothetical protein
MNIGKGFHRLALFIIFTISVLCWVCYSIENWNQYQRSRTALNATIPFIPVEASSLTKPISWSFNSIKYKEALLAGYSDEKIVEYLCKKYTSSFDIEIFKYEAIKVKTLILLSNLTKDLFSILLFAIGAYSILWILFQCISWVCRGFKRDLLSKLQ